MENKLKKIRRIFAAQLTSKHQFNVEIPDFDESSESTMELFLHEIFKQLNAKLIEQDQQLLKDTNRHSPLIIQRKQLIKDMDDFNILKQRQDVRAIQQIIERVEHMAMFNYKKSHSEELKSSKQPTPLMIIPMEKSIQSKLCSYQILCRELVDRLNWPSELFASEYDRCFCKMCYSITMPNAYQANSRNKYPVIIPRNWMKFGLKIDEVQAKIHQIWDTWAISYHGTLPNAALSMVKHRQICLPGDRLFDGTQLSIRPGHIPHQKSFFTSPTIRYAAQNHYSTPMEFTSQIDKCVYTAKIVLRCRQMPDTFTMQNETLNNSQIHGTDFCDLISDEQIEWKTDQRSSVIFDGLCVRLKKLSSHDQINHLIIGQRNIN